MAGATANDIAQMDKKQAEVLSALDKAEAAARGVSLPADAFSVISLFNPLVSFVPEVLRTGAQEAALANIQAARKRYEQWSDATSENGYRRWAIRGTEPDGFAYPVAFWLRIGDDLLSELGVHGDALDKGSTATVLGNTASQTKKDLGDLFSGNLPGSIPEDVKKKIRMLLWGLGIAGTLAVAAWGAAELAPLLALIPSKKRAEA